MLLYFFILPIALGRSRENSLTLIFFLKILPLKDDKLEMSEM